MTNNHEILRWIQEIDATLREWRQGDFVIGEHWFVYRRDPKRPLTEDSQDLDPEDGDLVESEVRGLVVVTQTCDIVRSCIDRPFIEVVPLVEVDQSNFEEIKKGRRPQYAFLPGTESEYLVAELDRVMTVEKSVVAGWQRRVGCGSDEQVRKFSVALARKRARFAFPDDFTHFVNRLQSRMKGKHGKDSDEGMALRALDEIRVRASPSWDADNVDLLFWFIRAEEQVQFNEKSWSHFQQCWENLIPPSGRFNQVECQVVTLEDLTAKDYIKSDRLDLDHLSSQIES